MVVGHANLGSDGEIVWCGEFVDMVRRKRGGGGRFLFVERIGFKRHA